MMFILWIPYSVQALPDMGKRVSMLEQEVVMLDATGEVVFALISWATISFFLLIICSVLFLYIIYGHPIYYNINLCRLKYLTIISYNWK